MLTICMDVHILPSEDTGETREGGGEPAETSKSTCQQCCGDHFLITSVRFEGRLDGHGTWSRPHSP